MSSFDFGKFSGFCEHCTVELEAAYYNYDYDDDDYDGECYWCGGDGWADGYEDDPLWYAPGEMARCSSCGGSGRSADMTIW